MLTVGLQRIQRGSAGVGVRANRHYHHPESQELWHSTIPNNNIADPIGDSIVYPTCLFTVRPAGEPSGSGPKAHDVIRLRVRVTG